MGARRNILFIVIDQWRADALGCAGNDVLKTPNLDQLAADGVLFRRHFVQAAPCGPSRAALLTGTYQHNNGVMRNGTPLARRFTNIALECRKAGYDPALFGYTDTTADPTGLPPDDPALQTYESVMPGFSPELHLTEKPYPWMADLQAKGYDFADDVTEIYRPAGEPGDRGPTFPPARFKAEDSITAFLTDWLLDYISIRRKGSWFAHAAYIRPHPPFVAPAPYHALYDPKDMPAPRRAATRTARTQGAGWTPRASPSLAAKAVSVPREVVGVEAHVGAVHADHVGAKVGEDHACACARRRCGCGRRRGRQRGVGRRAHRAGRHTRTGKGRRREARNLHHAHALERHL